MPRNHYLLHAPETAPTGRELGAWLEEHGLDIEWGDDPGEHRYEGMVRWGSIARTPRQAGRVLNRRDAIQAATNKYQALLTMREAGVNVPRIWRPNEEVVPSYPMLGRTVNHTHGRDIVLCLQQADIDRALREGCTYFTEYIPTKTEYRLHVFGEQVVKSSEKRLTDPTRYQPHIRNLDTGYTFHHVRVPASLRFQAVLAVEALGLHFGAVDVVLGDNNSAYVLEANTAPGLTVDSSLEAYGRQILEHFQAV